MDERGARVALYGHDTMGLGHLRRNLALAAALRAGPDAPQVLVTTGASAAGRFPLPEGVDLLVLPAVAKRSDGCYRAGRWDLPLGEVIRLRSAVLAAGLVAFAPDLLVVDKVPRGFAGELEPALTPLRAAGTRLVLGLRDVLDTPAVARAEWRHARGTEALRAFYDEVWAYGDVRVADPVRDLDLPPSVRHLVRHTGYLAPARVAAAPPPAPGRYTLCLLGGGQDGAALAAAYAAAPRPPGTDAVLVAGPYLPAETRAALHRTRGDTPGLHVVDFCPDPAAWAAAAAAVVCMGGYNTVVEVLATDTPTLVVPRETPRLEQAVRARRLSEIGAVDDVAADAAGPELIGRWLRRAVDAAGRDRARVHAARATVDRGGLDRVAALAARHVAQVRRVA